jgi:hypothetical protein
MASHVWGRMNLGASGQGPFGNFCLSCMRKLPEEVRNAEYLSTQPRQAPDETTREWMVGTWYVFGVVPGVGSGVGRCAGCWEQVLDAGLQVQSLDSQILLAPRRSRNVAQGRTASRQALLFSVIGTRWAAVVTQLLRYLVVSTASSR